MDNEKENDSRKNECRNKEPTPSGMNAWSDPQRTRNMTNSLKVTVCIKSNEGVAVDSEKVKNITEHGIQVKKGIAE